MQTDVPIGNCEVSAFNTPIKATAARQTWITCLGDGRQQMLASSCPDVNSGWTVFRQIFFHVVKRTRSNMFILHDKPFHTKENCFRTQFLSVHYPTETARIASFPPIKPYSVDAFGRACRSFVASVVSTAFIQKAGGVGCQFLRSSVGTDVPTSVKLTIWSFGLPVHNQLTHICWGLCCCPRFGYFRRQHSGTRCANALRARFGCSGQFHCVCSTGSAGAFVPPCSCAQRIQSECFSFCTWKRLLIFIRFHDVSYTL